MIIPETWKVRIVAGTGFVVLAAFAWLLVARANLRAELAGARASVEICRSVNAAWEAKAQTFNEATERMKNEAVQRADKAARFLAGAQREAEAHAAKAREIGAYVMRGDECSAARELVGRYVMRVGRAQGSGVRE